MNDKVKQVRVINATTHKKLNPSDPHWVRITEWIKRVAGEMDVSETGGFENCYRYFTPETLLHEFLDYLPVETIDAIWFCIRYDYKIMDEEARDCASNICGVTHDNKEVDV